ncbi:hypothetical protein, partial [Mycobacterium avium]
NSQSLRRNADRLYTTSRGTTFGFHELRDDIAFSVKCWMLRMAQDSLGHWRSVAPAAAEEASTAVAVDLPGRSRDVTVCGFPCTTTIERQ